MSRSEWQRLSESFEELGALEVDARARALEELASSEPELAARLARMFERSDVIPEPAAPAAPHREPGPGDRLGPWAVDGRIGAGAMGTVLRGHRADGAYEQIVAIKVLRPELATAAFRARFERESRILARLEHPGIARLLDAGTSEEGVPYLVMEFVAGRPLLEWCDDRGVDRNGRLRLLRELADAVQHAHARLIVHRDLKPGNVIVREDGKPILVDFGIGRLLDDDSTPGDTRIMTPEFASPEQLRGEPVGTASDVYSLGVVAFRLLTGRSPYRGDGSTEGLVRAICDGAVEAPSAGGDIRPRSDLERVLQRALATDPDRRYRSSADFGEDLEAVLEHRPVAARPDSAWYRLTRLLRRHPASSGAAFAATFSLLALVVALNGQVRRTELALVRAEQERQVSAEVAAFLVELFDAADPTRTGADDVSLRELLDRGRFRLERLAAEPSLRARVEAAMGEVYFNLGEFDVAEELVRDALELASPETMARYRSLLGAIVHARGDHTEADGLLRDALAQEDSDRTRLRLAVLQRDRGRLDEAAPLLDTVIEKVRAGDGDPLLLDRALTQRGAVYWLSGDMEAAEPLYREALDLQAAWLPEDHPRRAVTLSALSTLAHRRADFEAAAALGEEALAIQTSRLGSEHAYTARTAANLGAMYLDAGQPELAESHLQAARRSQEAGNAPALGNTLNNLGLLYLRSDRFEEAAEALAGAADRMRATVGDEHPQLAAILDNLGLAVLQAGRPEDARAPIETALAMRETLLEPGHTHLAYSYLHRGMLLRELGDLEGARTSMGEALAIRRERLGDEHPDVAVALGMLAQVEEEAGDRNAARELLEEALAIRVAHGGDSSSAAGAIRERLEGLRQAVR